MKLHVDLKERGYDIVMERGVLHRLFSGGVFRLFGDAGRGVFCLPGLPDHCLIILPDDHRGRLSVQRRLCQNGPFPFAQGQEYPGVVRSDGPVVFP